MGRERPKVVLYNPEAVFFTMPLSLVALGSQLGASVDTVIVDGRLSSDPAKDVLEHLEGALCLGITVLTGAPIRDAIRISREAKAAHPEVPVVWGGWHPSLFARECFEERSVDVTVQGQGEGTFAEIVQRLADGGGVPSLDDCRGCSYRADDGGVRVNESRPLQLLDGFRPHDYGLIPVEKYFELKNDRQLDYVTSQGCRFRCGFCADPFVYGRGWVGLPPDRVGEESEALWRRYGFDELAFQDETFFTSASRVDAIAEEFLRRELPFRWTATLRADQCFRLPEDVFAKCRASGLRQALIGVESGSQDTMDAIRKDITLEQVFFAAERCRRHGVGAIFPFIVGFPGESDASVQASLDAAKRLRAMSPDFHTPVFYFKPYPGSAITIEAVRERGLKLPSRLDEWASFDFIGSAGPWVSSERYRLVERFKFYQRLAWDRSRRWLEPLRSVARWRCRHDAYGFAVERTLCEWLAPDEPLA